MISSGNQVRGEYEYYPELVFLSSEPVTCRSIHEDKTDMPSSSICIIHPAVWKLHQHPQLNRKIRLTEGGKVACRRDECIMKTAGTQTRSNARKVRNKDKGQNRPDS